MRLYGAIQKVEPQDDGTVRVHGIATSEVVDDQGEIVQADAMRVAIPEYMRFPALREMHQLSAAGTTLEAEVGDDGVTRIVAHVVDPVAVTKVKNQVYRGFSIGGRVTRRDASNPKTITGLILSEISLVDRPANPEAVFDCWKAGDGVPGRSPGDQLPSAPATLAGLPFNPPIQIWACGVHDHHHRAKNDAVKCLEKRMLGPADCGVALRAWAVLNSLSEGGSEASYAGGAEAAIDAARKAIETAEGALAKHAPGGAEDGKRGEAPSGRSAGRAHVDYADPGYQADSKPRYPIDSERHIRAAWIYINKPKNAARYAADQLKQIKAKIIAAWTEKIGIGGPPSADDGEKASCAALTKALWDVGHVARIVLELDWLGDELEVEAAIEGDNSLQPARLQGIIAELRGFLNALVIEETGEILDDARVDDGSLPLGASELLTMAAGARGASLIAALLKTGNPKMQQFAARLLAKAKHSQGDQALADIALYACDKCIKIDGLSTEEKEHMTKARGHLHDAGAAPSAASPVDAVGDVEHVAMPVDPPADDFRPGDNATVDTSKMLGAIGERYGKRGCAHQNLTDIAHDCVSKLTDAMTCSPMRPNLAAAAANEGGGEVTKSGARHSMETLGRLRAAHDHLVAAGAACGGRGGICEAEHQGTEFEF